MSKTDDTFEIQAESVPAQEAAPEVHAPTEQRPEPPAYVCTARQWVRIQGIRWEHAAGFLYTTKKQFGEGALRTRDAWASEWETFQNRSV